MFFWLNSPELDQVRRKLRPIFMSIFAFSFCVNALVLTGPIFTLQVYDRVVTSGSVETLTSLFLLISLLFVIYGYMDATRIRIMNRIAAKWLSAIEERVFAASLTRLRAHPGELVSQSALQDVDAIHKYIASPTQITVIDLFFAPLFLLAVFAFHFWLGILSLLGGAILLTLAVLNQRAIAKFTLNSSQAQLQADGIATQLRQENEALSALGMIRNGFARWAGFRGQATDALVSSNDTASFYGAAIKAFRMFLQSAILALGAYLAIHKVMTLGGIIAASIIIGRALAPIEQISSGWPMLIRARQAWGRLQLLLKAEPAASEPMALPKPEASLELAAVTITSPTNPETGRATAILQNVNLSLQPGEALGVLGPTGSGKTSLGRAICGLIPAVNAQIKLGGVPLNQYAPDALGKYLGYLPQAVSLFDGTIADNIARLDAEPNPQAIVVAAKRAAAHDMIVGLPQGYDTPVLHAAKMLSGGQMQRIGLARALYGNPVILVLDEPNSQLDSEGSQALNTAIKKYKQENGAVVLMAHRPSALIECDKLMVLDRGQVRLMGPRDEVIKTMASLVPKSKQQQAETN